MISHKKFFFLAVMCFCSVSWAQSSDFVTLSGMQKPQRPEPPAVSGTGLSQTGHFALPSLGGLADNVEGVCGMPYINRTGLPIIVTIVAGASTGRYAQLFVKANVISPWVRQAYSTASSSAEAYVPVGGIYCPIANDQGEFYVTALQNNINMANAVQQISLWTDVLQRGLSYVFPRSSMCTQEVYLRTFSSGETVYMARYSIIYVQTEGPPTLGPCPVQESSGGGG